MDHIGDYEIDFGKLCSAFPISQTERGSGGAFDGDQIAPYDFKSAGQILRKSDFEIWGYFDLHFSQNTSHRISKAIARCDQEIEMHKVTQ